VENIFPLVFWWQTEKAWRKAWISLKGKETWKKLSTITAITSSDLSHKIKSSLP
jgi:hypothetical protein